MIKFIVTSKTCNSIEEILAPAQTLTEAKDRAKGLALPNEKLKIFKLVEVNYSIKKTSPVKNKVLTK